MDRYDAVVVGGGIVGASTAYHLADAGVETLLVDRADGGRATDAAAGVLSTATEQWDGPDGWYRFAADALSYYPALVERLEAAGERDHSYRRSGMVQVALGPDERSALEAAAERAERRAERFGHPAPGTVERIDGEEARARFPPLGDATAALFYPAAGQVDGRQFARALRAAGERAGLTVRRGEATGVRTRGGAVEAVETDGGDVGADAVVVAGGAWSASFADDLGVSLPVEPVRGQLLHLDTDEPTGEWPIVGGFRHHYVAPWAGGRAVVGATREADAGFAAEPTLGGVAEVTREATALAPGLADATVREIRVGLRPGTPDGLPVVGPVPDVAGAYVAAGHGAMGLQLGPYTGRVVAELLRGAEPSTDLSAFRVGRF